MKVDDLTWRAPVTIDCSATILEAAHIPMPKTVDGIKQKPLEGASFLASFDNPDFKGRSSQYFEIFTNRSMYEDGWKANAQHTLPWRQDLAPGNWDKDRWELYYLPDDFSEAVDLADKNPDKLAELKRRFDEAAENYHIYPFDDRGAGRLAIPKPLPPGSKPDAKMFTYFSGATRISETVAPPMKNRSWTVTANVTADGAKTDGVILGFGGSAAGLTLYVEKGVPVFKYNYFGNYTTLKGKSALSGDATVAVVFDYQGGDKAGGPALVTLKVNGEQVAQQKMDATVPGRFGIDTFGIGADTGQPVTPKYEPPFPFNGTIDKVTVELQ